MCYLSFGVVGTSSGSRADSFDRNKVSSMVGGSEDGATGVRFMCLSGFYRRLFACLAGCGRRGGPTVNKESCEVAMD